MARSLAHTQLHRARSSPDSSRPIRAQYEPRQGPDPRALAYTIHTRRAATCCSELLLSEWPGCLLARSLADWRHTLCDDNDLCVLLSPSRLQELADWWVSALPACLPAALAPLIPISDSYYIPVTTQVVSGVKAALIASDTWWFL